MVRQHHGEKRERNTNEEPALRERESTESLPSEKGYLLFSVALIPAAQSVEQFSDRSQIAAEPLVERRVTETVLAAEVLDRHPALDLLQEPDDLLVRKPRLLHVRFLSGKRTLLTLGWH